MNENLSLSDEGFALIEKSEGLRLQCYLDCHNRLTVGYGHKLQPDESYPRGITIDQAIALLHADVQYAEAAVRRLVNVVISQGQFDALTDFIFNEGEGHFANSTLRIKINRGDFNDAEHEFGRWVYAGGQVQPGLVVRREAERELFIRGLNRDLQPQPI